MTAFAGHLAVGEVLLLWDRIIGFDSLLPLPLLAVAVLAFRRQVSLPHALSCTCDSRQPVNSICFVHVQYPKQADHKGGLLQLLLSLHCMYLIISCRATFKSITAITMQMLLSADSKEQVISIMGDLSQLKTVPLLQGILFGR